MPSDILSALYSGDVAGAEAIAATRAELDLFEAAALGRAGRVSELVTADRNRVYAVADDGYTALHLAAFFAHLDVARVLLAHGADVHAVSANAMRVQPLHAAAVRGDATLLKLLLDAGADPDARQAGGWTALHARAARGDAESVRMLLERGADPALASDDGKTALDLASEKSFADVAALLAPR